MGFRNNNFPIVLIYAIRKITFYKRYMFEWFVTTFFEFPFVVYILRNTQFRMN